MFRNVFVRCKIIGGNRPISPQSFELPLLAEQYETYYKHRSSRYAPNFQIGRRKCTRRRKLYNERYPHRDAPDHRMSQFVGIYNIQTQIQWHNSP
ncbi:hypothetical protein TNCV_359791 [Trichonephila clavipes]|nr:hypothetical protein TNCV_359791 [Trichonephila clavipes]